MKESGKMVNFTVKVLSITQMVTNTKENLSMASKMVEAFSRMHKVTLMKAILKMDNLKVMAL